MKDMQDMGKASQICNKNCYYYRYYKQQNFEEQQAYYCKAFWWLPNGKNITCSDYTDKFKGEMRKAIKRRKV